MIMPRRLQTSWRAPMSTMSVMNHFRVSPPSLLLLALVVAALTVACGTKRNTVPPGTAQPDRYLLNRGNEELKDNNWFNAREYFRQIVDNYPQSQLRPEAKLGIGDTYLGEGTTEALVLAGNEFREFLTFYPTNPRADYAQFKLAQSHAKQMRAAERDQTETKEAIREYEAFFQRFPNSPLMPEVKKQWRDARDRLSDASYRVGLFYFRSRYDRGAISRFQEVLKEDPGYSRRDALYYYLAESLVRSDKKAEAIPYYARLLKEFEKSDYREDAQKRLEELKAQ
jgi:outer membrane protein assembly factor BamD